MCLTSDESQLFVHLYKYPYVWVWDMLVLGSHKSRKCSFLMHNVDQLVKGCNYNGFKM